MKFLKLDYLKNGVWHTIIFNLNEISFFSMNYFKIKIAFNSGELIEFTSQKEFTAENITNNYLVDEVFDKLKEYLINLGEEL